MTDNNEYIDLFGDDEDEAAKEGIPFVADETIKASSQKTLNEKNGLAMKNIAYLSTIMVLALATILFLLLNLPK